VVSVSENASNREKTAFRDLGRKRALKKKKEDWEEKKSNNYLNTDDKVF